MSRIVFVPSDSETVSSNICVKFVRVNTLEAWDYTANGGNGGLVSSYTTYGNLLSSDIPYSNLASGFVIAVPNLPDGRYYLYVFNNSKSSVAETDKAYRCWEFQISAGAIVSPPTEMLSDGVR